MKGNTDKCHLIMSTNNNPEIQLGDSLIKASDYEKLLGLKIDYKLNFDNHVNSLCKKASNKRRCNNNKIKHLHERCLRLTYCDKTSS